MKSLQQYIRTALCSLGSLRSLNSPPYIKRLLAPFITIFCALCATLSITSCITNSVPYPVIEHAIISVEGSGFTASDIDNKNRIVYLDLDESTDIQNVEITAVTYTDEAEVSADIIGTHDMRAPIYLVLSQYQNYDWQIIARQNIVRRFKVKGQIGAEVIDVDALTISLKVTENSDMANITISDLKLDASDITTYDPSPDQSLDFSSSYRYISATTHGRTLRWRVDIESVPLYSELTRCDLWACIAWLEGEGDTSQECGFLYRVAGSEEWLEVDSELVDIDEGTFSARLAGLTPDTDYEFISYVSVAQSDIIAKRSESATQLPNGDMEGWYQSGSAWYPAFDSSTLFWGTGNPGSTTIGSNYNLTTASSDTRPDSEGLKSAQLDSKYVLVKFAAGNLFAGEYAGTDGMDGIINFGRSFTSHPVALRFWVKYSPGTVDNVDSTPNGVTVTKGDPDTGILYVALGTWSAAEYGGTDDMPYQVTTKDQSSFFNSKGKDVSAYGEMIFTEGIYEWTQITIPLEYNDTSINHTHIIIVASASRYGDYFTGSSNSRMMLDDMELIYE